MNAALKAFLWQPLTYPRWLRAGSLLLLCVPLSFLTAYLFFLAGVGVYTGMVPIEALDKWETGLTTGNPYDTAFGIPIAIYWTGMSVVAGLFVHSVVGFLIFRAYAISRRTDS